MRHEAVLFVLISVCMALVQAWAMLTAEPDDAG